MAVLLVTHAIIIMIVIVIVIVLMIMGQIFWRSRGRVGTG
jgi:hypothetical protein